MKKKRLHAVTAAKRRGNHSQLIRLYDAEHGQPMLVNPQHILSVEPLLGDGAPDSRSLIHVVAGCGEHELFVRESLDEIFTLAQSKG